MYTQMRDPFRFERLTCFSPRARIADGSDLFSPVSRDAVCGAQHRARPLCIYREFGRLGQVPLSCFKMRHSGRGRAHPMQRVPGLSAHSRNCRTDWKQLARARVCRQPRNPRGRKGKLYPGAFRQRVFQTAARIREKRAPICLLKNMFTQKSAQNLKFFFE